MPEKVIILGSGPAGLTAAIYLARAGLMPLIIEGNDPGGQLMITNEVENFPGFPKGVMGPDLMAAMREQATRFGTRFATGVVDKAELKKRPLKLTAGGANYECAALIVATGATARWLGLKSETTLRGKGVSACATCDGFFFKGQEVVVAGGGDTALEEALHLSRFARSVKIVHRRGELRASKALQEKAKADPKISFVWNSVIEDIKDAAKGKVTAVILKNVQNGKRSELACDGVFVAIGFEPNTAIFKGQLELDKGGYIVVKRGSAQTGVEGVFAAGDVCDPVYRQAITAAGSGCMAALEVERCITYIS